MTQAALSRTALTLGLALLGAAGAQDLTAYREVAGSLDTAARVRPGSAPQALAQLDRAVAAFDTLEPTLQNRKLASGVRDAMGAARAALGRSPAELQAQVELARGLLRKALMDQTLSGLSGGGGNGAAQLQLLAREFGLQGASGQALVTAGTSGRLPEVAWRLQRAATGKVNAALGSVQPRQDAASYLALARATGWFSVVQDAAGVGDLRLSQFGNALRQLAGGDTAGLTGSLQDLRRGMQAFTATLAAPPAAGTTGSTTPAPEPAAPPRAVTPAAPDPAPTPTPAPVTGGSSMVSGQTDVYAALARAHAAASAGDTPAAREHLAVAWQALGGVTDTLRQAEGFAALNRRLEGAQALHPLRPQDVEALMGQLANVERASQGQPPLTLNAVSGAGMQALSGWARAGLLALLAALAVVPLRYLHLAFGGRNAYWRAIAAGVALLFTPLFLEGLGGLLGALGDTLNSPLRAALNLTLTQGGYGLWLWVVLSAAAAGLLTYGFRGLCEQFGLIGGRRAAVNVNQTQIIDWDEEV